MAFGSRNLRFAKATIDLALDATMAQKQMKQFRRAIRDTARITGAAFGGMAVALTPVVGLLKKATVEAVRFEEVASRFRTTFKGADKEMRAFVERMVNGLNQSRREMMRFTSEFQTLLVGMGFAPGDARSGSMQLTRAVVDLASFWDQDAQRVFRNVRQAITNTGETVQQYGIIINEATMKQDLLARGMDPKTADEYSKRLVRVLKIMNGLGDAQGDAARTAGSVANQWRAVNNQLQNTLEEVGKEMLPGISEMLREFVRLTKSWKDELSLVGRVGAEVMKNFQGTGDTNLYSLDRTSRRIARINFELMQRDLLYDKAPWLTTALGGNENNRFAGIPLGITSLDMSFRTDKSLRQERARLKAARGDNRLPPGPGAEGDALDLMPEPPLDPKLFENMFRNERKVSNGTIPAIVRAFGNIGRYNLMLATQGTKNAMAKGRFALAQGIADRLPGAAAEMSQFSVGGFAKDFAGAQKTRSVTAKLDQTNAILTKMLDWLQSEGVVFQ